MFVKLERACKKEVDSCRSFFDSWSPVLEVGGLIVLFVFIVL